MTSFLASYLPPFEFWCRIDVRLLLHIAAARTALVGIVGCVFSALADNQESGELCGKLLHGLVPA
jgi:hypothetical protein